MLMRGVVRCPPAAGDHLAVAQHHHAMQAVNLVERLHELDHRGGGNALGFGRAARQRLGRAGTTGQHDDEKYLE